MSVSGVKSSEAVLNRLGALVMNLVAYPLLVLWTLTGILIFPVCFLVWKLVTGWSPGRIMRRFIWIYGQGWYLIMRPFVSFRREGFENLSPDEPCVFVVNHLSFFDTYCMGLLPPLDLTFGVRAWPFRMPWYGAFMRLAGYLDVETEDWSQILAIASQRLKDGGNLVLFPEGHRSRTGELLRFYNGAFRIASELDVPLVPLCLTGTDCLLPPGRFGLRPAKVVLRVLPPLEGKEYDGAEGARTLRKKVKAQMAEALAGMRSEGESLEH